ncbi:MAG: hypothetical protein EXR72_17335 [Myxococcales bacterium]|nr:hypothetical protein [Myxococcales bacterium]
MDLSRHQAAACLAGRDPPGVARGPPARRGVRRTGAARRRLLGGQAMLRSARLASLAWVLLHATTAHAGTGGLRAPERLTAGPSDQLLGQLAPSGRLYFVSNQNATTQIFAAHPGGGASPAFDEAADVTWPRISPDGQRLLYISFRSDAAGDLCLRDLATLERRCLTGEGTSEVHALWLDGGRSIAVVRRAGLHGDLQLRRIDVATGADSPLLDRNLASPAVSPDGRWLAYVPLERGGHHVGPGFSAHAGRAIEVVRLDGAAPGPPSRIPFDLPGASGFPAFASDGKHLYFSQYLNDSNFDGTIDGADHSVLFRVRFAGDGSADPLAAEQLTSADWNCQYPAPAADRLIATCQFEGALHVYSLPLEGALQGDWTTAQLLDEQATSRNPWERLLLLSRLVEQVAEPREKARLLREMVRLHLALGEFESAEFYTRRLQRFLADPEAAGLGAVLLELAAHRRAERALARGQLSERFVGDARARLTRLRAFDERTHPSVAALAALARSEIHDVIGEKDRAIAELASVAVAKQEEPLVLHTLAARSIALWRPLGDGEAVLGLLRALAEHPALSPRERIDYAEAFVREVVRGRPQPLRAALLDGWRGRVGGDSDIAFLIDVERRLADLAPATQEQVRVGVFDLYRRNKTFDRRRALVAATIDRAARQDNDYLLYQFAETWVSGLDRERAERRRAERLYRDVVLERAYIESARGEVPDARAHFFGVTLQTDSLEAHIGFIESRLREGKLTQGAVGAEYEKRFAGRPDDPVLRFARAWLLARNLPVVTDDAAHERVVGEVVAHLEIASRGLRGAPEIDHLLGWVAHQRWLRTAFAPSALEADTRYQLALDLARDNPRQRAPLLDGLAALQSSVGNHRLALDHFALREKLPFIDPAAELAHRLGKARSLLHADRDAEAAREAARAVLLVEKHPALARFRPLVLDRAALCHLAAADFAGALRRYAELAPLIENLPAGAARDRDRLVLRIGRAAASLGAGALPAALADLAAAEPLVDGGVPGPTPSRIQVRLRRATPEEARESYRILIVGLRAQVFRRQGDLPAAAAALLRRRSLIEQRLQRTDLDEDRLELALIEAQLAECAHRQGDPRAALRRVEAGLRLTDEWSRRTGTAQSDTGLALLRACAELHFHRGLPLSAYSLDLQGRLRKAHAELCASRNPQQEGERRRLGLYLTLLRLDGMRDGVR